MKRIIQCIVVVLMLLGNVVFVYGAQVKLNSGKIFNGDIISYTDDEFSIQTEDGVFGVPYKMVDQIRAGGTSDKTYKAVKDKVKLQQKTTAKRKKKARKKYIARKSNQKIEIYVTSWCPYCKKLARYLRDHNIKFKQYDIERDRAANKRHKQMGGGGVPVTKVGRRVIRGYNPKAILAAIK